MIYFLGIEIDFTQEDLTTNSSASSSFKKQEGSYSDFYFNYGLIMIKEIKNLIQLKVLFQIIIFNQELPIN